MKNRKAEFLFRVETRDGKQKGKLYRKQEDAILDIQAIKRCSGKNWSIAVYEKTADGKQAESFRSRATKAKNYFFRCFLNF